MHRDDITAMILCCYSYKRTQLAHGTRNKSCSRFFCHRNTAVIYAKPKASRVTKIFWNQVTFILCEEDLTHHIQNQTVIIKITKAEITSGHDVNLRLYFMIVFTSRNHHLSIFSNNFTSQQPKRWLRIMKTLNFISHCYCIYLFMFCVGHMKFWNEWDEICR